MILLHVGRKEKYRVPPAPEDAVDLRGSTSEQSALGQKRRSGVRVRQGPIYPTGDLVGTYVGNYRVQLVGQFLISEVTYGLTVSLIVACRAILALSRPQPLPRACVALAIRDIVVRAGRAIQSSREIYRDSWCCCTMNT